MLDIVNNGVQEGEAGYIAYDKITVQNISNFNLSNLHLNTILPASSNEKLYGILRDVTGKNDEQITISDFNDFDPVNICLSTVLGEEDTSNIILKNLIEANTTIGGLGDAIDNLSLYDIYSTDCFVAYDGSAGTARYKHIASENAYVLDSQGTYMISKTSGIWLLLCFDSEDIEMAEGSAQGCAKKYTVSEATLGDLTNGSTLSTKITNATMRQLVDAGILPSTNSIFSTLTLEQAANFDFSSLMGMGGLS